jgi:hypothetical protein
MPNMHGLILALLTALFFLRVLGQALVAYASVGWLPAMQHWASGLIPYPALLAIQIVMLVVMIKISTDVWRGKGFFAAPRLSSTRFLIGFSAIYAGGMAVRYVLTMIFQPEMRWLGSTIPIFFHFVLAAFIYTCGKFHSRQAIFARPERAC